MTKIAAIQAEYAGLIDEASHSPIPALKKWELVVKPTISESLTERRLHAQWFAKLRRTAILAGRHSDDAHKILELADGFAADMKSGLDRNRTSSITKGLLAGVQAGAAEAKIVESRRIIADFASSGVAVDLAQLSEAWTSFSDAYNDLATLQRVDLHRFSEVLEEVEKALLNSDGQQADLSTKRSILANHLACKVWISAASGNVGELRQSFRDFMTVVGDKVDSSVLKTFRRYIHGLALAIHKGNDFAPLLRSEVQKFFSLADGISTGPEEGAALAGVRRDVAFAALAMKPFDNDALTIVSKQCQALVELHRELPLPEVALELARALRDRVKAVSLLEYGSAQISEKLRYALQTVCSFSDDNPSEPRIIFEKLSAKIIILDRMSDISPLEKVLVFAHEIQNELRPFEFDVRFALLGIQAQFLVAYAACVAVTNGVSGQSAARSQEAILQRMAEGYSDNEEVQAMLALARKNIKNLGLPMAASRYDATSSPGSYLQ